MTANASGAVEEPVDLPVVGGDARRVRLRPPRLHRKLVQRERLLAVLGQAQKKRVVKICAPAGYGKTVLAAQLSGTDARPSFWFALAESDNDPVVLLGDLVDLLVEPGSIAPKITRELQTPTPRIGEVALALLGEHLARLGPFVLVLDDVELVTHGDSLAIMSFVVDRVPPGSQVVLVTRGETEIPLARLRAAGDVLELGAVDLAFDASETRELLASSGVADDQQSEDVRDHAEGWAAGIALAMLSRPGKAAAGELHASAMGASREVRAYLIEEVLADQSPEVRRFLTTSSVLRRMSAALCDDALGITNSAQILAALNRDGAFIVPLNRDGEWYRYHRLFRELLEAELRRQTPGTIDEVLSRAAAWHEDHGDPDEAFEYAHACGDLTRAGRILSRSGETLIARGQIETVRVWRARCTRAEMASEPQLALAGAWVALLSGEAAEAQRLAVAAQSAADLDVPSVDGAASLRTSVARLRATLAADGVSQMLRDAEFVVAAERTAGTRWVLDGWRQVATAHLLSGRPVPAIAGFAEVVGQAKGRADLNHLTIHCLGYAALAAADAGDWRRARKWAREAHALATESRLQHIVQSVAPYTSHATVLLHDGMLLQAKNTLEHVRELLPMLRALRWWEADISLRCADVSLGLGETEAALELTDVARGALNHYPDAGMLPARLDVLDARLSGGGDLRLTPSELRLIPFLSSHLSLQEIADRIHLSRATVKTHTDSIYRKLDVSSRSRAINRLDRLGLCHGALGAPLAH